MRLPNPESMSADLVAEYAKQLKGWVAEIILIPEWIGKTGTITGRASGTAFQVKINEFNNYIIDMSPRFLGEILNLKPQVDLSRYPHKCQRCHKPAYIGFSTTECSAGCGQ